VNKVHLIDCMEYMKDQPSKKFDLSIVDPPYGIDVNSKRLCKTFEKTKQSINTMADDKEWDKGRPNKAYFQELFRVSKKVIIWGYNYFSDMLPVPPAVIVWDKKNGGSLFADAELAWSNCNKSVRMFRYSIVTEKSKYGKKIHTCQKPVDLYKWILKKWAKPEWLIFDSHVGSGSIRLACHDLGFNFIGTEIDPEYYERQEKRFNKYAQQGELFDTKIYMGV